MYSSAVFSRVVQATPTSLLNVIIALGIYNFGWGFADPFFSQFLRSFSNHYAVIGLLTSIVNGVTLFMVIPVAGMLERISRRQVLDIGRAGYVVVGLLYMIAGVTQSLPVLIIALIMNGVCIPLVWTSVIATVESESSKENASMTYGLYTTMRQLLWASGLLCALVILPRLPLYMMFLPVIIFPILSIWYTRKIPDPQPRASAPSIFAILLSPWMLLKSFYTDTKRFSMELWVAFSVHFLMHVVYISVLIFMPLFVIAQGYSIVFAGMAVCILSLPFIMSMFSAGLPQAREHWRMIAFGACIMTIGFCGLALWHPTFQHIAFWGFVLMSGYACVVPALGGIITAMTPKNIVGTSSAMIDISEFGSACIAAPIIGMFIDLFSWDSFFISIAVYCAFLTVLVFFIRRFFRLADIRFMKSHPHIRKHPYVL